MLRASIFLVVTLGVVVLTSALPARTGYYGPQANAKRDLLNIVQKRDEIYRRDFFSSKYGGSEAPQANAKRDQLNIEEKRGAYVVKKRKRDRDLIAEIYKRDVAAPAATYYYQVQPAQAQQTYYYVQPQQVPQYQVPQYQVPQQPTSSSSGGLLGFLSKPLNAAGDIVKAVGDTASNIVALPFNVVDTAVEGLGLDQTGVGQLATGVLDVGEAILQTPVQVASSVLQAPFRLAGSLDE